MKKIIALILTGTFAVFVAAYSSSGTTNGNTTNTNAANANAAKTGSREGEGSHSDMDNHANTQQHNHSNAK